MKIIFGIYTHNLSVSILLTGLWTEKAIKKLSSVISGMLVSSSVVNFPMDLKTEKARQKVFFISFIPSEVSSGSLPNNRQNIVCNFINVFICSSIYLSVNIIYHQQNTICNSFRELTVAVTFAIIIYQLSGIYRRVWFVSNPVSNI